MHKLQYRDKRIGTDLGWFSVVDSLTSLTFSMQSNKGVYALLLGSGVSRAAQIPTGWEITLDLIRKIAHINGEDCEPNPVEWYQDTYEEEPEYTNLVEKLANTPTERRNLLKEYIEPDEDDLEEGVKTPTPAHKAIAKLVAEDFIQVIITTNFDRLLEQSLATEGVNPTIISTPDAVEGALPLQHTECMIVKVNGDYLDTRIKNTETELEEYDDRIDHLLDQVFDEYGLIVCGWSAKWDTALRRALERCPNHRFTTYWTHRSTPEDTAQQLIHQRRAKTIQIQDADTFFQELADGVLALQDSHTQHPASVKTAVARLKKYIVDEQHKIRLHDLVTQETENVYDQLTNENFPVQTEEETEEIAKQVHEYEALTETLLALIINGCYWGGPQHVKTWVNCIERIANHPRTGNGKSNLINLRLYPALLLLYGGGIASIAKDQYKTFKALLTEGRVKKQIGADQRPPVLAVKTTKVDEWKRIANIVTRSEQRDMLSEYLFDVLREPFRDLMPDDDNYERTFNRFECLFALVHADLSETDVCPIGRFNRQGWRVPDTPPVLEEIENEVDDMGEEWPPLQIGLFDGSVGRFDEAKDIVYGLIE